MKALVHWGRKIAAYDHSGEILDASKMDVIISLHPRWLAHGLVLGDEAILIDHNTFASFRVKSGNLGFNKHLKTFKLPFAIDKVMLSSYFQANNDNPYAIQHAIVQLTHEDPDEPLTQFPPLNTTYTTSEAWDDALDRLAQLALPGDHIFTSQPNDEISSPIRKIDRIQFSHVGIYAGHGEISEMCLDGPQLSTFRDIPQNSRVALYRPKCTFSQEDYLEISRRAREFACSNAVYPRLRILLLYLRKRYRLPVAQKSITNATLLYSNKFELITYV